jgi:hypothetical protein
MLRAGCGQIGALIVSLRRQEQGRAAREAHIGLVVGVFVCTSMAFCDSNEVRVSSEEQWSRLHCTELGCCRA